MDLVTILQDLLRRRLLVVFAALAAVLAALVVAFEVPSLESRRHEAGLATARILVDTPNSQVIEVAPKGSDTLGARARLLGSLMVEGVVKATIAKQAELPPSQLQGIAESAADLSARPPQRSPGGHVLSTRVVASPNGDLPIIEVEAHGPDAASAAKLANAAVEGLRDYLDSKAALERVSDAKRLRVTGLGAAQGVEVVQGPSLVLAVAVALLTFGLGCAAILVVGAVIRGWRAAAAADEVEGAVLDDELVTLDGLPEWDQPAAPGRLEPPTHRGARAGRA